MGCDFGPDGNLYVADNQVNYDANNESRLLRINVVDGKPVSCDVIAEGFVVSNAVIWRGNTLYVAETVLVPTTSEGAMGAIYAFQMEDWADGPVQLETYSDSSNDPHLIETFKSSGRVGFSTDGLTFDGQGNLYSSIFEDGIIYKTMLDESGDVIETILFAEDDNMASADGIFWNKSDDKIYVADMLNNAVQVVDMEGNVTTLHENGDTDGADGSLDQPCEVVIRGNQLIVVNMDWYFESEYLINTKTERPFTLTEIEL